MNKNFSKSDNNKFDPKLLRRNIIYMAYRGGSVHIACAFSIVEIVSVLYSSFLNFNPNNPNDPDRDYFILSKGHGVMALYAAFRQLGWISQYDLDMYFSEGSKLHGLCESHVPGLEVTSGSLGHGLPIAVGIAFGYKMRDQLERKVYCVVGDGEMNEGSMWEAMMFAEHYQLSNLVVIVDANGFQAMGETKDVINMEPIAEKFRSFGFSTIECDGHNLEELSAGLTRLSSEQGRPKAIIARTIKGKGISFMEGNNIWHYTRLNDEWYEKAMNELG